MGGTRSRSEAVVEAVADRENCGATEVEPPLYEVVDPGALDRLFEPTEATGENVGARVIFRYKGYRVVVTAGGDVRLEG